MTVVPSTRTERGGQEDSSEHIDMEAGTWRIVFRRQREGLGQGHRHAVRREAARVGAGARFSELRPGGKRLRGYGWISSGWEPLAKAMAAIAAIMQGAAHRTLTQGRADRHHQLLGTVLSSRRSAQICLIEETEATTWEALLAELGWYVDFKTDRWERVQGQREQSNNSIGLHAQAPSRR